MGLEGESAAALLRWVHNSLSSLLTRQSLCDPALTCCEKLAGVVALTGRGSRRDWV